ncbi:MAG: S-layer homology domain-containing protein [Cyanobacteria bacterium P01_D01_bin.128]
MEQSRFIHYVGVNAPTRDNGAIGTATRPFASLTQALAQAQPGTTLQVLPGTYSAATGESFPLRVPAGVIVQGEPGREPTLLGGGEFSSATFGSQSATLILSGDGQLRHLVMTNPTERGTGVWLESSSGDVYRCQLVNCRRDGILVTGNSLPLIAENQFRGNGASGISLLRNSKGEVRGNSFEQTGYGIAVSDEAAPLLQANQCRDNRSAIVVSRSARPVLRENYLANNRDYGLVIQDQAAPDLGQRQSWGGNRFVSNGQGALNNQTRRPLVSVGNLIDPSRAVGAIALTASTIPDRSALPPRLLTAPPEPLPPKDADDESSPPPDPRVPTPSRFQDLATHWSAPFINPLIEQGAVQGFVDGSFRPNAWVTRAEFAALVAATFPDSGLPGQETAGKSSPGFRDVPSTFWARDVILQARDRGFISGYPDGTFRPDRPLTRVQALVAIAGGLDLPTVNGQLLSIFRDRVQIPSYAVGPLAAATQRRLVVNYPDPLTLNPLANITRGEVGAILYQSLVDLGLADAIPSDYIARPDTTLPGFTDTANHWAADFITAIANQGLIRGYADGSFQPERPITRAQFATVLVNAFRPQAQRPAASFRDVPPGYWAASAVQQAYQAEFLSGFPDQTFSPENPILRVQVIVSLINGLGLMTTPPSANSLRYYQDANQIPTYGQAQVARATELGMVVNYPQPNRFNPGDTATRAEVSALVYQAMVAQQQAVAIASPFIVEL